MRHGTRVTAVRALALLSACILSTVLVAGAPEQAGSNADDLAAARDGYVLKTRAYTEAARQRALSLVADALAQADRLTRSDLHLRLLEIVGLADNGHDVLSFGTDAARPALRMPYRLAWFPDALIVVRATGIASDLAGARVEAIEGVPPTVLYQRLSKYAGGVPSQRKLSLGLLLESPELLQAVGIAPSADRLTLDLVLPRRGAVRRTIEAVPGAAIPRGFGVERLLAPDPVGPAERGWTTALDRESAPLSLREGSEYFRVEPLLEGRALYVQFRINFTFAGQDIGAFQDRVLSMIGLHQPTDLLLDLRFDTGGDLQSTLDFMRALPSRVPGKVYVLISRYTFSAGIVSAAAVKKAAPQRVVMVGEPAGDRLRFWSEGGNACLPHSGFCLHYTDGLFDMNRGCGREAGCYGDRFDVNVGELDPDISAPMIAADYLAGRDRAVDAVLALLH